MESGYNLKLTIAQALPKTNNIAQVKNLRLIVILYYNYRAPNL